MTTDERCRNAIEASLIEASLDELAVRLSETLTVFVVRDSEGLIREVTHDRSWAEILAAGCEIEEWQATPAVT